MCLEFLCSWSHREEDGPEHNRPRTPLTGTTRNSQKEHKNGNYYPEKNEPRLKPRSEQLINGTETSKGGPARDEPPSRPRSKPSVHGTETWEDEYTHAYPARNQPPSKLPWEPSGATESTLKGEYYTSPARDEPPSKVSSMGFNGGNSKAVHPRPSDSVPYAGNNTVLAAPVHEPNPRRGVENNVLHTNGARHPYMRKYEEEQDEEVP